jgi:hypothetical protein
MQAVCCLAAGIRLGKDGNREKFAGERKDAWPMNWIVWLALPLGGPFGLPMCCDPPPFWQLESTGGWPGQGYDFNQFLPPAIAADYRLTVYEQCCVNEISRDTRLGQQLRWEMRPQVDRILPPPPLILPPPLSVLQPTGQERSGSLLLSDEASPRVPGWKMLHVDVTETDHLLLDLTNQDERVRLASVRRLGHLKLLCAVDALTATLSDDPSGIVREAAVRALTVIGAGSALSALQQAADSDPNREVRRTALFAVEILEAHGWPALSAPAKAAEDEFRWYRGGFFN